MPFGVQLYVKDHRHAAGRQPFEFYERVARLPNVVLVHPQFDTKTVIRHARAVVCSTSTLGFEALLLRRPLFVLGHPFYDFVPGIRRIQSFDGAHDELGRYGEMTVSRADVEALLAAYYLATEPGTLDLPRQKDDPETIERITRLVVRATREHIAGRLRPRGSVEQTHEA
jgi:hypothetical protein